MAVAAAALQPRAGANDGDAVALVQAQELREAQFEAAGDLPRDRQRRAGLATLHLRQHGRRDTGPVREVAQRQVHRLAQRADAGTDVDWLDNRGTHGAVRYHIRAYALIRC